MRSTLLTEPWLQWAIELQSLAQNGLAYSPDVYDRERYERLREIAAEMLSHQTEIPVEKVKRFFCNEHGYQTPKIDTRAAVFQEDKILLVQESDGRWALPGGWIDVWETIRSNAIKEVKEEAGLDVEVQYIIAIHSHHRRNVPDYPYSVLKTFVMCESFGGEFTPNNETVASGYFALNELPLIAREKNSEAQIALCFEAHKAPNWLTQFD